MPSVRRSLVPAALATVSVLAASPAASAATVAAPKGVMFGLVQDSRLGWFRLPGSTLWTRAAGNFYGAPVPVKAANKTLLIGAATPAGALMYRTLNTGWKPLTNGSVACSTPSAVASGNTIHVACTSAAGIASYGSFDATATNPTMKLTVLSGRVNTISVAKTPSGPVWLGTGSWYTMTDQQTGEKWQANTWIRMAGDTVWTKFGYPCDGGVGFAITQANTFIGCVTGPVVSTLALNNSTGDGKVHEITGTLFGRISMVPIAGDTVQVVGVDRLQQTVFHPLKATGPTGVWQKISGAGRYNVATPSNDLTIQGKLAGTNTTRQILDQRKITAALAKVFGHR